MINLQISRAKWLPNFIKNLMPEFLDYIVSLVSANKPFLTLIQTSPNQKNKFYLHAPEVGGSSLLVALDLLKEFANSEVYVLSDHLSKQRQEHFQILIPDVHNQVQSTTLKTINKSQSDTERILLSINHAHLLSDQELVQMLRTLSENFDQIIIGEGNNKSLRQVIGMLLLSPLVALFCTPAVKPFKVSRLLLTYAIPLVPIMIAWDGMVALFKIRTPEKLQSIINSQISLQNEWTWNTGKAPNNRGGFIIYLHGRRKSKIAWRFT